jgi:hypothetical protein
LFFNEEKANSLINFLSHQDLWAAFVRPVNKKILCSFQIGKEQRIILSNLHALNHISLYLAAVSLNISIYTINKPDFHTLRKSGFRSFIFQMAVLKNNVDFWTTLIGAEGAKTPVGIRGRGDPAGAKRRGGSPDRPRTARSWSRNQHASLTEPNS